MSKVTYSIANDTLNGALNSDTLSLEIQNSLIGSQFSHINTEDDVLDIFTQGALSAPDELILTGIVNLHEGISNTNNSTTNTTLISNSGRFYCYSDKRWITDSDDNYGSNYYQFAESGGTGTNPIVEWEHLGFLIPAGKKLKSLKFLCRANSSEITDFEISIQVRVPNPITRYGSGFDNDGEMTNTEIFRGNFVEGGWTGNMADRRLKTIDLGDYETTADSQLSMYIKPIGTNTGTRYLTCTYTYEVE